MSDEHQHKYKYSGYYENGEYQHDCTGTILTPTIVITAAHCTIENDM